MRLELQIVLSWNMGVGIKLKPLQDQQMLFTADSSSNPLVKNLKASKLIKGQREENIKLNKLNLIWKLHHLKIL